MRSREPEEFKAKRRKVQDQAESSSIQFDRESYLSICTRPKSSIRQLNDFQKNTKHSLFKSEKRFVQDSKGTKWGGSMGGGGPFFKKSNNGEIVKRYYISNRDTFVEYFIFEILKAIGMITPKLRFIDNLSSEKYEEMRVAAKDLPGYIPVGAYEGSRYSSFAGLEGVAKHFDLDEKNQIILDKDKNKSYRINGNRYGCLLTALFVQDWDFQPHANNCGFIFDGHRYYFSIIDKDRVSLGRKKSYSDLVNRLSSIFEDFPKDNEEQRLAIACKIDELIKEKDNKPSNLYQIFFNDRTSEIIKKACPKALFDKVSFSIYFALPTPAVRAQFHNTYLPLLQKNLIATISSKASIVSMEECSQWISTLEAICLDTYDQTVAKKAYQTLDFDYKRIKSDFMSYLKEDREGYLSYDPSILYQRLKKNAELIVDHHFETPQKKQAFAEREQLRYQLAHDILLAIKEEASCEITIDMFENLVEDLRGPYYVSFFNDQENQRISKLDLMNVSLRDQIKQDILTEYNLSVSASYKPK